MVVLGIMALPMPCKTREKIRKFPVPEKAQNRVAIKKKEISPKKYFLAAKHVANFPKRN
jgi:hypothetical protein